MTKTFKIRTRLKETASSPKNGTKFQVLLIQEGLGNLKDCFYYTKQSLQSAPQIFEGKKCYADHPSSIEENVRPERSTRDILGYYQNVTYSESADGRGQLVADLITVVDPNLSWAQALLSNSIQYAQTYQNADFVGLSINASGEADETPLQNFIQQNEIPNSVMPKLQEAISQGIDTLRVVSALKDALSCDLVTDAGAGGRILKMIEQEKKPMAKKESKEKESKENKEDMESKETGINPKDNISEAGEEGEGTLPGAGNSPMASPTDGGQPDHADADQDTALFQQLIAQYLGGDEGVDPNEAMQMAKHAHEAAMEAGMSHEEAMEAAGNHLKMSAAVGKKMSQCKQSEGHEAFPPAKPAAPGGAPAPHTPPPAAPPHAPAPAAAPAAVPPAATEQMPKKQVEKYYESMRKDILRLNATNARLSESLRKYELGDYLEKKMKESKKPVQVTTRFREAMGPVKSKEQIDQYWKFFLSVNENRVEEVSDDFSSCLMTEKNSFRESNSFESTEGSFEDCLT